MDFQKISKFWNLARVSVLQAQKLCNKFQDFELSTKRVIETQKCNQAASALFCRFLACHANFDVS